MSVERIIGISRPINITNAQRLARIGVMHEVQRCIDELYSGAAEQYDTAAMIPVGSQIPLGQEDGKITYA